MGNKSRWLIRTLEVIAQRPLPVRLLQLRPVRLAQVALPIQVVQQIQAVVLIQVVPQTRRAVARASSAGVITDKDDTASKASSTTDNNASNDNDNLNIKIDGNFNDWKNVTLTEGYDGYTAMVSDGKYVYVYVKMKYGQVPGYGDYNFDISGQKYYVWSGDMPSSQSDGAVKAVSFTGGEWNEGHQYGTVGNGYVSQAGSHSIAEFRVDLSKFKISTMTGQTITMYNPNIGNEKVTVAGGSTGPYLISGVGVVIVAWGYFKFRKRRQLEPTDLPKVKK